MSEFYSLEDNEKIRDYRLANFKAILREQFQLAYFGKIGYEATDDMTILERHTMYGILVEQKETERKSQEEALRAAEAKKKSGSWRKKR